MTCGKKHDDISEEIAPATGVPTGAGAMGAQPRCPRCGEFMALTGHSCDAPVVIQTSQADWEYLSEVLEMDADSGVFDEELKDDLRHALDNLTVTTPKKGKVEVKLSSRDWGVLNETLMADTDSSLYEAAERNRIGRVLSRLEVTEPPPAASGTDRPAGLDNLIQRDDFSAVTPGKQRYAAEKAARSLAQDWQRQVVAGANLGDLLDDADEAGWQLEAWQDNVTDALTGADIVSPHLSCKEGEQTIELIDISYPGLCHNETQFSDDAQGRAAFAAAQELAQKWNDDFKGLPRDVAKWQLKADVDAVKLAVTGWTGRFSREAAENQQK